MESEGSHYQHIVKRKVDPLGDQKLRLFKAMNILNTNYSIISESCNIIHFIHLSFLINAHCCAYLE